MSRRSSHKKATRAGIIIAVFLLIFGLFALFTIVFPVQKAMKRQVSLRAAAKNTFGAAKTQDLVGVQKGVGSLQKEVELLQKEVSPLYMYQHIPFVGYVFSDLNNALQAGGHLLSAGNQAAVALEPYADLIGFKKGSSFSNQSTEDRLETAILTIDKLEPQIDKISQDVAKAQKNLEKIDPDRYPEKIGSRIVRARVRAYYDQINGFVKLATDARPLFKQLPEILGKDKEKKYLVLFLNDAELRPTGGFITAYAVFSVDKGQIRVKESSDIYDLDSTIAHGPAPAEILRYHKGVNRFYIRDSNLSPDYVQSIKYFEEILKRGSKKLEYDGIIALDTNVLVDTLAILGPTEAGGVTFTADKDDRCWGCPQVIYELENIITRPTPYFREQRKSMLSVLLYNIMQKALGVSPSQYWGRLAQNFLEELDEKHMLVYLKDPEAQKAIEALNYGGRIREFDGDYLHVNNTNFAGAKSNLFIDYAIESRAQKKGDLLEREVVLEYKNSKPASDCNLERGNLCLNAPLRNWVRIYVPKGAKLKNFVGSEMPVRQYEDLGKQVFEGFVTINPQGKAEVRVTYELPSSVLRDNTYALLIQKQPGIEEINANVSYNSKQSTVPVRKDTVVVLK